jgi:hypothetical protein
MRKIFANLVGNTQRDLEIDRLKKIVDMLGQEAAEDEKLLQKLQKEGAATQKYVDELTSDIGKLESVIAFENENAAARMQPIEFVNNVPHFKGNGLIQKVMHEIRRVGLNLESVLRWNAMAEDKEQLLQLMGVSVSSYQKQGHVSLRSHTAVRIRVRDLQIREEARKAERPAVLSHKPRPGTGAPPRKMSLEECLRTGSNAPVIAEGIVAKQSLYTAGIAATTAEEAALLSSMAVMSSMKEQGICLDVVKATETAVQLAAGDGFYAGGNIPGITTDDGPIQRQISSSSAMAAPYGTEQRYEAPEPPRSHSPSPVQEQSSSGSDATSVSHTE